MLYKDNYFLITQDVFINIQKHIIKVLHYNHLIMDHNQLIIILINLIIHYLLNNFMFLILLLLKMTNKIHIIINF